MYRFRNGAVAVWLMAIVAAPPVPAAAHPHAWIDVWVEVMFDANGRVTALKETWLFDDFYTAFATEGLDQDGDGKPDPDRLDALRKTHLTNLAKYDYFTRIDAMKGGVAVAAIDQDSSRMRGSRLETSFRLVLREPVPLQDTAFSYAIFDPTYYIEMVHAKSKTAVQLTGAPEGCRVSINPPNPDPKAVALAAALDRTQTAGDGLGQFFAERVLVRCP